MNPDACFATLALGREYRFHAQRLALDLSIWAPAYHLLVLTDAPEEFKDLRNVTAEFHRNHGLLRSYHDKRFLIERSAREYPVCIVIDANTRILAPLPASLNIPKGIAAFWTWPAHEQLTAEGSYETRGFKLASSNHIGRSVKAAAATLQIDISKTPFLLEFMYAISTQGETLTHFLKVWNWLSVYFDYQGLSWSEGYAIGLAAASAGPDYATAIGLMMAGATMPPELLNPALATLPVPNKTENWLSRLTRRWL